MKRRRILILGLVATFLAIQLVPVARPAAESAEAEIIAPPDVKGILRRSCYDCHSTETKWPLYSRIAPVSWIVIHDVNEGRDHLDFSNWQAESKLSQSDMKEEILDEVSEGKMPLKKYLLIHRHSKLSDSDKKALRDWVEEGAPASSDDE